MAKPQFSFETRYLGSDWLLSALRFNTIDEAADDLRHWVVVSAQNGIMAECRLKEINNVT